MLYACMVFIGLCMGFVTGFIVAKVNPTNWSQENK